MTKVHSDKAYMFIRRRIATGEYPPGFVLLTHALAKEIGVSRTPVRDALRQLESEGLVSIRPRVGANVKVMDAQEFRDLCGIRWALEGYAAMLAAANRTEADLLAIRVATLAMRRITEQMESGEREVALQPELNREDVRFHVSIIGAAKNPLLKKHILRLHLINRIVWLDAASIRRTTPTEPQRRHADRLVVQASHEEILTAIELRDCLRARAAMENHIQALIDQLLTASNFTEPSSADLSEEELHYTL